MGTITKIKLYFRFILISLFSSFLINDYLNDTQFVDYIINFKFFKLLSLLHILWIYLIIEMLIIIIPKFNHLSYNGKHLLKHFKPANDLDVDYLISYTKKNSRGATRSAIFWIILNTPFAALFFLGYLGPHFFYWLFFLYYFFDTVCINIFCIFHLYLVRNKCCNECRIFNWGNFMYCTPLLFIPNTWNYILVFLSIIILIQWEVSVYYHPNRFSPISNQTLQCKYCVHDCRYHIKKQNTLVYNLNQIGENIYHKFKKEKV